MKKNLLPLVLLAVLAGGCGKENTPAAEPEAAAAPVNMITVTPEEISEFGLAFDTVGISPMSERITVPATIIFNQDRVGKATVLVAGRVKSVMANYGDQVRAGQVLATLESMEFGRLIADAMRMKAGAETSKLDYDRAVGLHKDRITSDKAFQQIEAAYLAAKAEYAGIRHQLAASGMTAEEIESLFKNPESFQPVMKVRAPIAGVVTERNAAQGSMVQPEEELFTIVNNATVSVEGHIFQEDLSILKRGMKAAFHTTAFPDEDFRGTLAEIGAALDDESHTLPVWCSIPNPKGTLRPNLKGELTIETGAIKEGMNIPAGALIFDGNDTYVFRDGGNGTLEYVQVQAGQTFGDRVAIQAGLKRGDRIAVEGVFMLKSKFKLSQQEEE